MPKTSRIIEQYSAKEEPASYNQKDILQTLEKINQDPYCMLNFHNFFKKKSYIDDLVEYDEQDLQMLQVKEDKENINSQ